MVGIDISFEDIRHSDTQFARCGGFPRSPPVSSAPPDDCKNHHGDGGNKPLPKTVVERARRYGNPNSIGVKPAPSRSPYDKLGRRGAL